MSQARADFVERLQAFSLAASQSCLAVRPPTEVAHNNSARLLRNGLAVVGFSTLEDFIRRRTGEIMGTVNPTTVRFADLPEEIQSASTVGAVAALKFQAELRRRNGGDPLSYVQMVARSVASTATAAFSLSDISFGYERSNIGDQDVSGTLKAFLVKEPWIQVTTLAGRVGLGGSISYKQEFTSVAAIRHTAAHAASSDVALLDLEGFAKKALAIALAFDVLLTHCVHRLPLVARLTSSLRMIDAAAIRFRFIDPGKGSSWRETVEGSSRAVRVLADADTLFREAVGRAKSRGDVVVLRNAASLPVRWLPTDGM